MAIYKIFPSADASIYSLYPAKNTGLDSILEVSVKNSILSGSDDIRRSLILFSDSDITKIKNLKSGSWDAYLKLYLANAENLSIPYNLQFAQLTNLWTMGTGKFVNDPEIRNGVCWYSTSSYSSSVNTWTNPSYYLTSGGGSWNATIASQSFSYQDSKDINANVTSIVTNWFNGNSNCGIIMKHSASIENNPKSYLTLNYFSRDTHTIYPPCLEIGWDDSSYITGSLKTITTSEAVIGISNNPGTIISSTDKYTFRITARDRFPVRQFTTGSIYLMNKCLPSSSYWSIQDVKTEDTIIDFNDNYTKISCDSKGNYFNIYISGLEPERYYKIIVKTLLDSGESFVTEGDNSIFKIIR